MTEQADLAQAEAKANGFEVFHHVVNGVLLWVFQLGRLTRAAFVDEDELVGTHQRQEIRQEVVVRSAGPTMHDYKRRAVTHNLVINQSAVAIDEALLNGVAGRFLRSLSEAGNREEK